MNYDLLASVTKDFDIAGKRNHLEQKAGKGEPTQG